jgi:23S rRNA (guanine745-N1)-methyltransferase
VRALSLGLGEFLAGRAETGAVFACPVCWQPLALQGGSARCENGHAFDSAREGYVNLLLAQHRHSKDPGYSKEMIAARRAFFDQGHYLPLAAAVADMVLSYLPGSGVPLVLDAGCGEGYYLRVLRERLGPAGRDEVELCGLDISKHGVRQAARRDPGGLYAVAGTFRMPVLDDRVDVLLTHFSPVSAADFRRVVPVGGMVLVGGPGEDHLFGLKELLYDVPARFEPADVLGGEPGFELVNVHSVRYPLALRGPGQVANLLAMTPFYWSAGQERQAQLATLDALDTEVDVLVRAYRRT